MNFDFKEKYLKYKFKYLQSKGKDLSYPIQKPFNYGFLDVGNNHKIYFEESGNPNGIPMLFIHGGPGGGLSKKYSKFHDPQKIRLIGFDQRGCGRSTPYGEIKNNTTWDLINDMEKIRIHLNINKWHLTGGSWGSTLALVYAINHPQNILGILISGVCLLRQTELNWLYQKGGASNINPEEWDQLEEIIPQNERNDMISAYYKRLTSENENIHNDAVKRWCTWELTMSSFYDKDKNDSLLNNINKIIPLARIECHYFINKAFFPNDNYILDNIHKIKDIPLIMVQGKYDIICPLESAYRIKEKLPNSELIIVVLGGHDAYEIPFINYKIKLINKLILSSPSSSL